MSDTAAPDTLVRCPWPGVDPLYVSYHDKEWGVPEFDARALYEKLVLDGFQAGLSWITILRKRENFRRGFDGFEPATVARYGKRKIEAAAGQHALPGARPPRRPGRPDRPEGCARHGQCHSASAGWRWHFTT